MPKRPSAYLNNYRKVKKQTDLWLNEFPLAESGDSNLQLDYTGCGEGECLSQGLSVDSTEEVPDRSFERLSVSSGSESSSPSSSLSSSSSDEDHDNKTVCFSSEEAGSSFQSGLAKWVVDSHTTREHCNSLLSLLRNEGLDLPKDQRTLIKTPRSVTVYEKCGGQYLYFGLKKALHAVFCGNLTRADRLNVQINVDGIPIYKSNSTQFWPILCSVNNSPPMLVALFLGKHKPSSLDDYLSDFIEEARDLTANGFICSLCVGTNNNVPFLLHSVIADAPARSFLKQIRGHNSLHACERCEAVAVSVDHRTVFNSASCFNAQKRCNTKFSNVEYIGGHQIGPTPLCSLTRDCIDICALDYMHLVCLGVVKRMINFWKSGERLIKQGSRQLLEISEKLLDTRNYIPSDFSRKPRTILEIDRWKATECRQFLLYTGPVVLKSVLSPPLY
jgi:hypothetical protein